VEGVTFFPVLMFDYRGVEFTEEFVGVAQLVKLSHPKRYSENLEIQTAACFVNPNFISYQFIKEQIEKGE
jgi:hypothetical protein